MWPLPSHQSSILSPSKPNPSPNGQSCFYFAASITVLYPVPSCIASSTQHPHLLGEIVFDSWCSLIILVSAQMLKFFCKYTLDFSLTRMNYFSTLWFISIFSLSSFVLRLIFSRAHSCALFKAPSGHGHSLSAHPDKGCTCVWNELNLQQLGSRRALSPPLRFILKQGSSFKLQRQNFL